MKKIRFSMLLFIALMTSHLTVNGQCTFPLNSGHYFGCTGGVLDPSAAGHFDADNKGLLIPRMTEVQKLAIVTPATGLLVFQTDAASGFHFYNGTTWQAINSGATADWGQTGNAGTTTGTNFIGTTDNVSLIIKTGNVQSGYISNSIDNVTFLGFAAGLNSNLNTFNTAIGRESLYSNTTGLNNGSFGVQALYSNTTGNNNHALGRTTLYSNTIGNENVGIGPDALFTNTSGSGNIAIGRRTLQFNSTGFENVAIGGWALNLTTGYRNIAIGQDAGNTITTGNNNLFIGVGSDAGANNLDNATAIGNKAYVDTSNAIVLGAINGVNSATSDVNVGIGTTIPSDKLHVVGTSGNTLRIEDGNQAAGYVLTSDANGNASWQAAAGGGGGSGWDLTGNTGTTPGTNFIGTTDAQDFVVSTNATERMRVKSDGKIGIGTDAPYAPLHVHASNNSTIPTGLFMDSGTGYGEISIAKSNGTITTPTAVQNGDVIGLVNFKGYNAAQGWFGGAPAEIRVVATEDYDTAPKHGGRMIFNVTENGTGGVKEGMRIDQNGFVGMGIPTPARKLHVEDVMRLEPRATVPSNAGKGDIYFDSTVNKLMVYDGTTWQACW